jgi:hypothetical protein
MTDKSIDLDEKINILYEYTYSNYKPKNIELGKINIKNINIDDIKFRNRNSDFYHNLLSEILDGRFKLINISNNTTILKKYSSNLSTSLFISPYKSKKTIDNIDDPNNNDALFSYLFSPIVLSGKTKHILLPVINIDADFQQISDVLKNHKSYERYVNDMDKEKITNQFSIRVKENFFKSQTLLNYINDKNINMKNLLFQVIHTLATIQDEYPTFRHNKLHPKNIMMYQKKKPNGATLYTYNGVNYYLPDNDFEIKIANFSYSTIPEYFNSLNIVPLNDKKNKYFDIHYFLNILYNNAHMDDETLSFLSRALPEKYRNKTNNYYLEKNVEHTTPKDLLNDKYFETLKNKKDIETNMSDNNYMYGTRKLSRKNNVKQKQTGGGLYKKPMKGVKNDPFTTRENKRIYKSQQKKEDIKPQTKRDVVNFFTGEANNPFMTKGEKKSSDEKYNELEKRAQKEQEEIEKKSKIIAQQTIRENPFYIRPMKSKDKPFEVPQAKLAEPVETEVMSTYSDTEQSTTDTENNSVENNSVENKKPKRKLPPKPNLMDDKPRPETNKPIKLSKKPSRKNSPERKRSMSPRREYSPRERSMSPRREYSPRERSMSPRREYSPERKRSMSPEYKPQHEKKYKTKYMPNVTEQPVIAEQKVYQQQPPMGGSNHTHPKDFNPAWVDTRNQMMYPQGFIPEIQMYPGLLKPNTIPLQKVYNINLGNPLEHDSMLNSIYEDVLPGDPKIYTYKSINTRQQLNKFIRNSILRDVDGEYMSILGGKVSLSSYIRLLQFNPYNVKGNPYSNLPYNFMLYNAAYPIKYDLDSRKVNIAQDSLGLNVRLYGLNLGSLTNKKFGGDYDKYNIWREIKYYEMIKNEILQQKVSPNFISILFYKLDTMSRLDYRKLNEIIQTHKTRLDFAISSKNEDAINNQLVELAKKIRFDNLQLRPDQKPGTYPDLSCPTDVSLIAVTEAPTQNVLEWASPIYNKYHGAIKAMVNTGVHQHTTWRSVLFQITHIFYILQQKELYFEQLNASNNIFIKELFANPKSIGHWQYNVTNVDFYVPNYGYLVMFDSRYVDTYVDSGTALSMDLSNNTPKYKITGKIYNDGDDIDSKLFTAFKKMIEEEFLELNHLDIETKQLLQDLINLDNIGFKKPDIDIEALISGLTDDTQKEIVRNSFNKKYNNSYAKCFLKLLIKCFPEYLHSKVGSGVSSTELQYVSKMNPLRLSLGSILSYQYKYGEYMWCMYLSPDTEIKLKHKILIKEGGKYIVKSVFKSSLIASKGNLPHITTSDGLTINNDTMIEKYIS